MSSNSIESDSPALGARTNWWGDDDLDPDHHTGHAECPGTDKAQYVAFQLALDYLDPVCAETGNQLSDPEFYLPKQRAVTGGHIEYRSHRHRRRVEPESGRINWGESTSTAIPEFDYDVYLQAVGSYLMQRHTNDGLTLTKIDDYVEHADRLWSDPSQNSHGALTEFVRYVRERERT